MSFGWCILWFCLYLKHIHISMERNQFDACWNWFYLSINETQLHYLIIDVWIELTESHVNRLLITLALTSHHVSAEHLCELLTLGIWAGIWLNPLLLGTKLHRITLPCTCRSWSVHTVLLLSWCAVTCVCDTPLFSQPCCWGNLVTTTPVNGVFIFMHAICLERPYCRQYWV